MAKWSSNSVAVKSDNVSVQFLYQWSGSVTQKGKPAKDDDHGVGYMTLMKEKNLGGSGWYRSGDVEKGNFDYKRLIRMEVASPIEAMKMNGKDEGVKGVTAAEAFKYF